MNLGQVEKIAEAVLYEGYMLYPYRPSSVKNQRRWNFGVLCPPSYCEQQHGTERDTMQTEVLLRGDSAATLTVKVRFLQIIRRSIGKLRFAVSSLAPDAEPAFDSVERLEVRGRVYQAWQEAVEREIVCDELQVGALASPISFPFEFDAHREVEPVYGDSGTVVAVIVREWERVSGSVEISGRTPARRSRRYRQASGGDTESDPVRFRTREATRGRGAILSGLCAHHSRRGRTAGSSLCSSRLSDCESLAAGCQNVGTWPVLVGEQDSRQAMLSSPIILYDYPQIAPESAGSLFDGTEIDEILSLRIMTLTDDEKREMRQSDDRAREILERTENLPEEQFMKLHGVLRGLHPMKEEVQ